MADVPEALVSEITKFSTKDGPGIRTTVFLKGCPLRCKWCSNPETWEKQQQLFYFPRRCRGCGKCETRCPQGAISPRCNHPFRIDRRKCSRCMACTEICPARALEASGTPYTVDALMAVIERDKCFYGKDGGVTVSGGEPLMSGAFVLELFRRCKAAGIGTVLDTSGYGDPALLQKILSYTDLVLLDLKHIDNEAHIRWTGVSNRQILKNAELIAASVATRISFPVIGGVNDAPENVRATAEFARKLGVKHIDMNPLHTLGAGKYNGLGKRSPYRQFRMLEKPELNEVAEIFRSCGLQVGIGRMM